MGKTYALSNPKLDNNNNIVTDTKSVIVYVDDIESNTDFSVEWDSKYAAVVFSKHEFNTLNTLNFYKKTIATNFEITNTSFIPTVLNNNEHTLSSTSSEKLSIPAMTVTDANTIVMIDTNIFPDASGIEL